MQKKLLISAVVALVLIGGAVFVWQKKGQQGMIVQKSPNDQDVVRTNDSVPNFEEIVGLKVDNIQSVETELYVSEKNKFSVRIPTGTKVSERDEEGGDTLTYFNLKDSVHVIMISSHWGDVNASNLQEMIVKGKEGYLLTGGFNPENRLQCGDQSTVCFLSQLYSSSTAEYPTPLLMRLVENIISQGEFSSFYSIEIGAYHPLLTSKDLSLFKQFHDSFRLLR